MRVPPPPYDVGSESAALKLKLLASLCLSSPACPSGVYFTANISFGVSRSMGLTPHRRRTLSSIAPQSLSKTRATLGSAVQGRSRVGYAM